MLGNKIKELRLKAGLTQAEFSKAIGISRSTIGMIETTTRSTSKKNLQKLSQFFNVSIDYLLVENNANPTQDLNNQEIDLKEIKLTKEFKKLNEKGKDEAIKRIRELAELPKYKDTEIAEEIIPLAAHEKDGEFTKEDYKHDINIMKNDDLWK